MRLSFRQGVVRYQTDNTGIPAHLYLDVTRNFISLIVAETPTLITFAHRESNYLVEEPVSVIQAWGPIIHQECWMYWDINLFSGIVTRGMTTVKPITGLIAPSNPIEDTHWFDTSEVLMKVFLNGKWQERIRVFAGHYRNGYFNPFPIGSQVGIENQPNDAGYILMDPFNVPLRFKPPGEPSNWYARFITSETWLTVVNRTSMLSKLDSGNFPVLAAEPIPKFSLVQLLPDRRIELARHTDHTTRVNGIILEDMYPSDVADLFCHGMIANDDWEWENQYINKPLYAGAHGELTTSPPATGVYQQVGFVFDRNSVFIDLQPVIILDEIQGYGHDEQVVVKPVCDFAVDIVEGYAPLTVTFTSTVDGADMYEWDFENNGHWDSTGKQVKYTFTEVGVYTVRHRVSNKFGSDTKIVDGLITITPVPNQTVMPNLKFKLAAIGVVKSGVTFKLRGVVSNVGLGIAYQMERVVKIRANTGTDIVVVNSAGGVVSKTGAGTPTNPKVTIITFPRKDLNNTNQESFELELKVDSYAQSISIIGTVSSLSEDSTPVDDTVQMQLPIRF